MPVMQGLEHYNTKMLTLTEHYDEFVMKNVAENPNIWYSRIPRASYELFSGLEKRYNVYRGGLPVQGGLNTWRPLALSRKPSAQDQGYDNCAPGTPHTYQYAWESVQYGGYTDEWQSEPVCLEDLKWVDYAREQLAMVMQSGVDYGISILENWNREMYLYQACLANRTMVLCEGALQFEDSATYRFSYDPFVTTTDADGADVPYIKFDKDLELSSLTWRYLDYVHTSLSDRSGQAALSKDSGMPVFGLMIDIKDFERMIYADDDLREDFRYAKPQNVITGYDFGMKVYRGFALIHDARQMRFRYFKIGQGTNSTDDELGQAICTRVLPMKAGRKLTIGNEPVPDPKYYRAEIGLGVIFMNDVFVNLFVPSIDNLGSGMTFGPAPGLTGEWKWINIPDPVSNMLGQTGFFYGRFQIFPKPLLFSASTTAFVYKRCPQAWRAVCGVEASADVGTGAVALAAAPVAGDFSATRCTVALTLVQKLEGGVGTPVTIKNDAGNTFAAFIADSALAPTYTFAWTKGDTNVPADETAINDITKTTVTVA